MNVIVIVSDTCRADRIGAYGCDWMNTPALDYLASQSMVFERCYCASFRTVPHRVDFLLGRYGFPFYGWSKLPDKWASLPEVLGKEGVITQLIYDTPGIAGSQLERGFDGAHFNSGQRALYNEVAKNPLMIYLPDGPRGERCDALVQPVDLRPTILEILGIKETSKIHGRSLMPLMIGEKKAHRKYAFSSRYLKVDRPTFVAINSDDGWSLHIYPNYNPELYFLPTDKGQNKNIINEHPLEAERLHQAFLDFLKELKADSGMVEKWQKEVKIG